MHVVARCTGHQGLRHHCVLQALHDGDHESGDRTWPRTPKEIATMERHRAEIARLRERVVRLRAESADDA